MWLEAIITAEDFRTFMRGVTPLEVEVDGPDRKLILETPESVEIVPDVGLRLKLAGHVRWTIAHINVPNSVRIASVLLLPTIEKRKERDALVFRFRLEHLDLKGMPEMVDDKLTEIINESLAKTDGLAWSFTDTLDFHFKLPKAIESSSHIDLAAKWGTLRITKEALVLAASFEVNAVSEPQPAAQLQP